ncbi:uncharacterized protein LOC136030145 isoform X1 [Artemia franciscana]|uniref:uncharacterized protein LOC136030145 isoform X1 n=1 Tax=Artemia franciscana TaxID=6661 RepID=UPI0032DB01E5
MKETLERIEKANENKMSKMHNINSNLVKRLERVKEETEDKISKMHNINAFLVKELERVKKANDEMSKILGINANLVEILERVVKRNEDKMSKMYNINANLVKELERVKKTNHEMSKIFGINANLVKKLERVEKGNEDKMLMIKSKLELLEAEMAKFRISKSNSLHIESATLKQGMGASTTDLEVEKCPCPVLLQESSDMIATITCVACTTSIYIRIIEVLSNPPVLSQAKFDDFLHELDKFFSTSKLLNLLAV